MNMALKTIRELTNQFVSPREFIPDVKSKDFTREETQAIQTNNTNSNRIDRANNFDITDLKKERKFKYDYHHSDANRRIMDIINKRDRSPEIFRIVEKNRNLQSRETFDSNLTATLTEKCSFRESQTWTNAVASFDLELIYRCNEKKNRWAGGYFDFKDPWISMSPERNKREPENVSSTEQSEVVRPTAHFFMVGLKDYDNAQKTLYFV